MRALRARVQAEKIILTLLENHVDEIVQNSSHGSLEQSKSSSEGLLGQSKPLSQESSESIKLEM